LHLTFRLLLPQALLRLVLVLWRLVQSGRINRYLKFDRPKSEAIAIFQFLPCSHAFIIDEHAVFAAQV
jgi:hypothetical protein